VQNKSNSKDKGISRYALRASLRPSAERQGLRPGFFRGAEEGAEKVGATSEAYLSG
jgi:hypothetical protein